MLTINCIKQFVGTGMHNPWQNVQILKDQSAISTVEKRVAVSFPLAFIDVVKKHNGGRPANNLFDTEKENEKVFSHLLTFNLDAPNSIVSVYEDTKERLPSGVFPFGTDPAGNYICFDYRSKSEPEIVFWNHEEQFVAGEERQRESPEVDAEHQLHEIEYVAPDFFEFLSILYAKEDAEEDFSDFEVM